VKAKSIERPCQAGAVGGRGTLLQLGGKTNRAGIKNWIGFLEVRDTVDMFMGGVEVGVTGLAETLMPQ
jgi:hypothetical protein